MAATGAFAQSSVTLWGIADAGIQSAKQSGISKTQLTSSGLSSSQLGFRGTEDLGGGMTAGFWFEAGLSIDGAGGNADVGYGTTAKPAAGAGSTVTFSRRQTLDLSTSYGAFRLGRDYTPTFWNHTVFDPFGTLGSGAGSNITGKGQNNTTGARTSNGISYLYGFAPNAGSSLGSGLYAQFTLAFGEQLSSATSKTGEYTGMRVGYADGPLNVAFSTGGVVSSASNVAEVKDKETNFGGSYNLGVATLMAKYGTNTLGTAVAVGTTNAGAQPATAAAKYTWTSIGATVPLGNGYLPVSYNSGKNDANAQKGSQLAVGYVYNLSKRTNLYTTYSKLTNSNGATYGYNGGNGGFASGLPATGNGTAYDFGIRHSF